MRSPRCSYTRTTLRLYEQHVALPMGTHGPSERPQHYRTVLAPHRLLTTVCSPPFANLAPTCVPTSGVLRRDVDLRALQLVTLVAKLLFVAHLLGCFWYYIVNVFEPTSEES